MTRSPQTQPPDPRVVSPPASEPRVVDFFRLDPRPDANGEFTLVAVQQFMPSQKAWVDLDWVKPRRFLTFGSPRRFVDPGFVIWTLTHGEGAEPVGRLIHKNGNRHDHNPDNLLVVPHKTPIKG